MSSDFLGNKVVEHFRESKDVYAQQRGVFDKRDKKIIKIFKNANKKNAKILEIGGGSGYFLEAVINEMKSVAAYNCELAYDVYKNQVIPDIDLIGGNALNLPFKNDVFEFVMAKNVLHHLVGKTRKISKRLVIKSISEFVRIVKSGGYVTLFEEFHQSNFIAGMMFYISLVFSMFNFRFDALGIRPKVIVSFLTPKEIRGLFDKYNFGENHIVYEDVRLTKHSDIYRYLPLINRLGVMIFIIEIKK